MSRKTAIYLSDRAEAVIGALPEGASLSGRINQIADRYGELIARARRRVLTSLSSADLQAIRAACQSWATRQEPAGVLINGVAAGLEDAALPGGDLQGQDLAALIERVRALNAAEQLALIELLEMADRGPAA